MYNKLSGNKRELMPDISFIALLKKKNFSVYEKNITAKKKKKKNRVYEKSKFSCGNNFAAWLKKSPILNSLLGRFWFFS